MNINRTTDQQGAGVGEDANKLQIVHRENNHYNVDNILASLREDNVVLAKGVSIDESDQLMWAIANKLNLNDQLELQAGFSSMKGHRHRMGKYYMSVNQLGDYQCLPPHSEGNSTTNIQIISLFCHQNKTDGGKTLLMNVNQNSAVWSHLREKVLRIDTGNRTLSQAENAQLKMRCGGNATNNALKDSDQVLGERTFNMPEVKLVDVLATPQQTYSTVLEKKLYAYWSSIENIDANSSQEYEKLLYSCNLHRSPIGSDKNNSVDLATPWQRVWSSGLKYSDLFTCKITLKLSPGDFVIANNQSWTHAVTNWTPNSGERTVAVAFA